MDKKTSYEDKYRELEQIIERLQSNDLDLDDAVKSYERGSKLIAELEDYLKQAQVKVTQVKAKVNKSK